MRKHQILVVLAATLLLTSSLHCAAKPYTTGAHIDAEYDFSSVKTFAFALVPSKPLNSDNGKILRATIQQAMTARGFEEASQGSADLWIAYDVGILDAVSVSWGKQSTLGEGRIIVRAIDPATKHEVWYGWVEANLRRVPEPEKRIAEAVDALFQGRVREIEAN